MQRQTSSARAASNCSSVRSSTKELPGRGPVVICQRTSAGEVIFTRLNDNIAGPSAVLASFPWAADRRSGSVRESSREAGTRYLLRGTPAARRRLEHRAAAARWARRVPADKQGGPRRNRQYLSRGTRSRNPGENPEIRTAARFCANAHAHGNRAGGPAISAIRRGDAGACSGSDPARSGAAAIGPSPREAYDGTDELVGTCPC